MALAPEIEPVPIAERQLFLRRIQQSHHGGESGRSGFSEFIALAIGLGTTNPAQVTDTIATAQAPTTQQVQVMVGSKMAQPSYAGLFVGGTPGYYQVAFTVPVDAAAGNQPVTISVGGFTSNSQTLVVAPPAPPVPAINAIVNGATFKAGKNPQAANSFVSIFGQNFGSANTNGNIFPAKSFQGLSVLVNGTAIPLYVVAGTGGQINVVLPSELGTYGIGQRGSDDGVWNQRTISVGPDRRFSGDLPHRRSFRCQAAQRRGAVYQYGLEGDAAVDGPGAGVAQLLDGDHGVGLRQTGQGGRSDRDLSDGLGKATPNGDPNGKVLPTGSLAPTNGSVLYKTVDPPVVKIGGVDAAVSFQASRLATPGNIRSTYKFRPA